MLEFSFIIVSYFSILYWWYLIKDKTEYKRTFVFLFASLLLLIYSILHQLSLVRYPNINNIFSLLAFIILCLIPFFTSIIYVKLKKNYKVFTTVFFISWSFVALMSFMYICLPFTTFYESKTTNIDNYLKVDDAVNRLTVYDEYKYDYFPKSLEGLDVKEYYYSYSKVFDLKVELYLQVKIDDNEFDKKMESVDGNYKLIEDDERTYIVFSSSNNEDSREIRLISFDRDNLTISYIYSYVTPNTDMPDYIDSRILEKIKEK